MDNILFMAGVMDHDPWVIDRFFHTSVYMKHPNGFIIICAKKHIGSDIKCLMKFSYQVVLGRPVG